MVIRKYETALLVDEPRILEKVQLPFETIETYNIKNNTWDSNVVPHRSTN